MFKFIGKAFLVLFLGAVCMGVLTKIVDPGKRGHKIIVDPYNVYGSR